MVNGELSFENTTWKSCLQRSLDLAWEWCHFSENVVCLCKDFFAIRDTDPTFRKRRMSWPGFCAIRGTGPAFQEMVRLVCFGARFLCDRGVGLSFQEKYKLCMFQLCFFPQHRSSCFLTHSRDLAAKLHATRSCGCPTCCFMFAKIITKQTWCHYWSKSGHCWSNATLSECSQFPEWDSP